MLGQDKSTHKTEQLQYIAISGRVTLARTAVQNISHSSASPAMLTRTSSGTSRLPGLK